MLLLSANVFDHSRLHVGIIKPSLLLFAQPSIRIGTDRLMRACLLMPLDQFAIGMARCHDLAILEITLRRVANACNVSERGIDGLRTELLIRYRPAQPILDFQHAILPPLLQGTDDTLSKILIGIIKDGLRYLLRLLWLLRLLLWLQLRVLEIRPGFTHLSHFSLCFLALLALGQELTQRYAMILGQTLLLRLLLRLLRLPRLLLRLLGRLARHKPAVLIAPAVTTRMLLRLRLWRRRFGRNLGRFRRLIRWRGAYRMIE